MGCLRGIILAVSIIIVVAFGFGVAFIDGMAEKFEPLLCAPGERVLVERWQDRDGTSANVYCVGEAGKQISWRSWVLIIVPIPLGLLLMALVGRLQGSNPSSIPSVSFGSAGSSVGTPLIIGGGGGKKTLADRLRELDQAYQAGLITKEEFDRTRQQILDSQADV